MPSTKRRAPISASILISIALAASGCVSARPIVASRSACSSLVGPSLRADVAGVDLPGAAATAGDLWAAFDGQTGRLDTANTFKRAVLETVEACEKRDAEAVREITRPWWRIWK